LTKRNIHLTARGRVSVGRQDNYAILWFYMALTFFHICEVHKLKTAVPDYDVAYSTVLGLPTLDLGIQGLPPLLPFPSPPSFPRSPPSFPFPRGPTPKPARGSGGAL